MRPATSLFRSARTLIGLVAVLVLAVAASNVAAAPQAVELRALLLTERFTPAAAPAASNPLAASLVALRGETEGFQLAIQAPGKRLSAALGRASDPFFFGRVRVLRVGFVDVRTPSAKVSLGAGRYADPLPPLTASGLATTPGEWAGFVILIDVPTDATPGTYKGEIVVDDEAGRPYATHPFELRVSALQSIARDDRRAFKAIGGFLTGWYLREAPIGDPQRDNGATLLRVYRNLTTFLADHHISPTGWDYGRPDSAGNYADGTCITCWWRSPDFPAAYHEQAWPAKVVPSRGDKFVLERNWKASGDAFLRNVGQYWQGKDWIGGNSYLWVWDEPGNVHETTAIPAINKLVHKHAPGVKAFATAFPYERTKPRRLCKRFGNRACHVFPGVKNTNKNLWDGGDDDLDAWLIAAHRYYGKWTSGLERQYGIDRSLDAYRLQQKLRTRGKEVWSYTYFMPTQSIPQLTIDSPPTDRRLLMLWNAYERNTGWLTWHLNRWVDGRVLDASKAGPRNPYNDPIASKTPKGELANGDVSLMYPPVAAQYGLSDPTAPPVTSIRLEELRDGIEDVNLVTLYRERFGDAATRRAFAGIFGKVQVVNGAGYTWPAYSNTGLSTRMEQLRRSLVAALER